MKEPTLFGDVLKNGQAFTNHIKMILRGDWKITYNHRNPSHQGYLCPKLADPPRQPHINTKYCLFNVTVEFQG